MTIEKYVKDGKVAVLVSVGYGAGWSTWNRDHPEMLFDPVIVELVLERTQLEKQNVKASDDKITDKIYEHAKVKYPDAFTSGAYGLRVIWVQQGEQFRIVEHDGYESIEFSNTQKWVTA